MPSHEDKFIISDTQVFVFLILSKTIEIVFNKNRVTVYIPAKVVKEIKEGLIARKYPDVKKQFTRYLYDKSNNAVNFQEITLDSVTNEDAIRYYFELEDACFLDAGEREGVVLALQHQIPFLSDDEEAIDACIEQAIPNIKFMDYITNLKKNNVLTSEIYQKIITETKK